MKKLLIFLGTLFVLFLAAIVIIPLVVDVDKYRPDIVNVANEHLNGKLELGRLKLSLWGKIRIEVGGVKLTDAQGRSVLGVKDAYFHVPFASIFSGSPILTFKMEKADVNVVKDKDGKLNVMSLVKTAPKPGEPTTPATGPSGTPLPEKQAQAPAAEPMKLPGLVARARLGVELLNAQVNYKDDATGLASEIKNFNLLVHDLSLSRTATFEAFADLDTTMGKLLALRGPFRLDGEVKPEFRGTQFDQATAKLKLNMSDVVISVPGMFEKRRGVPATVDGFFSSSEREAKIERLDVKFNNAEIKASGAISNLAPSSATPTFPIVNLSVKSNDIELAPWADLIPMLREYELGGSARLDANVSGPADKFNYKADFILKSLTAKAPHLKAQPTFDGAINIVTDKIENMNLTMKAPGNDLKVSGKMISFTQPVLTLDVTSTGMDLDQLIDFPPPAKKGETANAPAVPAQGQTNKPGPGAATAKAPKSDFDAMLDPLRQNKMAAATTANANLNIKMIKAYGVRIDNIVANKIKFANLAASIESLRMGVFGGTIGANFATDLKPKAPTYRFDAKVDNLSLKQAVESQMSMFKHTVLGTASFQMDGAGASFNPDAAIANLKAKGKVKVANAKFLTIDVGKMVAEAVNNTVAKIGDKIPPLKGKELPKLPSRESRYEYISSSFNINEGKFVMPDFAAKAEKNQGVDIKGTTTIGMQDFSLKSTWDLIDTYNFTRAYDLSPEVQGVKFEHILAEKGKPVHFPVGVNCTLMAPCYSNEATSFLIGVVETNAKRAAGAKVESLARQKAQELLKKNVPPETQKKVEQQAKDAFKKLFGR